MTEQSSNEAWERLKKAIEKGYKAGGMEDPKLYCPPVFKASRYKNK